MRDLGQKRAEMQMWTCVRFLSKNQFENVHLCTHVSRISANLGHPIRLPSQHRINFSVCLSVHLSVYSSVIYEIT